MKNFSRACLAMLAATAALPTVAFAQEESTDGITISASATVVSDYRFRGVSQTGEKGAIQGGFTVSHDSGFYVGTWGSSVNFGGYGESAEIDAFVGYSREISTGLTADIGATAYFYPGYVSGVPSGDSTIFEPYFSLSGDVGPASLKAGVAWAPGGQNALADDSAVYLYGDLGVGIPSTPFTLKGHVGYAKSDSFLGGIDGDLVDYSIGLETSYKQLTLGVSYVNTDMSNRFGAKESWGADGAVIFSLGASF
jgi:uncharacterized protein (TIGR02001 family)